MTAQEIYLENLFVYIYLLVHPSVYVIFLKYILFKINIQNAQNIALNLDKVFFYFLPNKLELPTEDSLIFLDNKTPLIMSLYFLTENTLVVFIKI